MQYSSLLNKLKDPQYKGIIFDFDETLFLLDMDWKGLKTELENTALQQFNIEVKFTPYIEALTKIKMSNSDAYNHLIKIIERVEEHGLINGRPNTVLLEFIKQNQTKKFGIYSMNTTRTLKLFIDRYNLQNKLSPVISQQTCIENKPSGKDLLHIANKWRYNNTEVIYIGNSDYDKKSGEMANITTEIIQM